LGVKLSKKLEPNCRDELKTDNCREGEERQIREPNKKSAGGRKFRECAPPDHGKSQSKRGTVINEKMLPGGNKRGWGGRE